MFEDLYDFCLGVLFDPLFHEICSFVLFGGLDFIYDHIVEVVAQDFPDFVPSF